MGAHWGNIEDALGTYLERNGDALGTHWGNIEDALGTHWGRIGYELGTLWGRLRDANFRACILEGFSVLFKSNSI